MWIYHRVTSPNNADGNVDPDQTEAVWPEPTLFAQTCLSKILGSLPYMKCMDP